MEYISSNNQPISAEQVYSAMLKRILKLQLEPGQRISENQMCEEYGTSRFVIRNVFTRLNQLELLTIYPQRGTYVSLIDLKYIEDLLVLRSAVEKEVLYEMFAKIKESDRLVLVEKLENNLKLQESSLNEEYSKKFQELDSAFHKIMIDSVKRYRLMKILENPMLHITRWRNLDLTFFDSSQRMSELIEEHRAIVNAIKENNLNKAQQAIGNHLETISKFGNKAMEKYPHYFTE
jgi:GntR family transcriptional regulator, rspAB operon transcriptional repressor